ncbi:hypothetical protein HIM_03887 [Hirsutella minnesotensis 3608]|uniref:IkappaB kinase n=1 Tax=Hirsutella minnesotensis 3608 TaxID=1043627 RepID=A0A0F7ZLM7_9HYPO|nr:hypothetical protein HIM_03887 [Hirsutella minnesotensis 3608]
MDSIDLIARVYPVLHATEQAQRGIKSSKRCVLPRIEAEAQDQRDRHGRGLTEQPEDRDSSAYSYLPCVELRFSDIPRTKHGLIFGCDPKSDVVLPNRKGISYHHFTLTFDDTNRLIVKDWGSLWGTEVVYSDEGHGKRRNFQWIVSSPGIPSRVKRILVKVDESVQFEVVGIRYDITSQAYIDKVDRFRKGAAPAEELFDDLDLPPRADTELPTVAHTPGTGAIYLSKELGRGAFAIVTHFWDVSTGEDHALKAPYGEFDVDAWTKEARIMGQISHKDRIVRLLGACFTPRPQLYLEYVPGGSLEDQENISGDETISILRQCLSALTYLHGKDPQIAHRDIKPNNIFVQQRYPGSIYVKLGDFGLSKDSEYLKSICGTRQYLAPEIYTKAISKGRGPRSYTIAVDIWSLGVVACGLICGLPRYRVIYGQGGTAWGELIVNRLVEDFEKRPNQLTRFLLDAMVVIPPASRWSAKDCSIKLSFSRTQ